MPVLSFVYCIINSYLYIHFNNFFTPHSPLDGAGSRLIRFHGNQRDNVGIPSAKRKREATGI